jgi:hypothetical protein
MLGVTALRADVDSHVLTRPTMGTLTFLNILRPLAGVYQRDVLRRGDDDGAGHRTSAPA